MSDGSDGSDENQGSGVNDDTINSTPPTTTLVGGLGLALAGLLGVLPIALNWIPGAGELQSVLSTGPAHIIRVLALLAGCVTLAFGFRTETGIVGSSTAGRIALLLLGLGFPLQSLVSVAILSSGAVGSWQGVVAGTVLQLLPIAATFVAGVVVVRAQLVTGVARWGLCGVAAAEALVFLLSLRIDAPQSYLFVVLFVLAALPPLLLAVTGASLALHGRTAAITGRARRVYLAWRLTT